MEEEEERNEILQIKFENFTGPPVSIRNNRILQKNRLGNISRGVDQRLNNEKIDFAPFDSDIKQFHSSIFKNFER